MKFGIRKRQCAWCVVIVIVNICSDVGKCADELLHFLYTWTVVFPMEKVKQMIVMSFYDVTMISHAIGKGSI